MVIGTDLDGTLTAYPAQLGALLGALRAQGHQVHIVTGVSDAETVDQAHWQAKADTLASLGLGDCYDELCVVPALPDAALPQRKVLYLRSVGASVCIDNNEANARAMTAAGICALVPWATREQ